MRAILQAVRFFLVVPPVPRLMRHGFAAVTVGSSATLAVDPRLAPGVLTPLLLLQAFATATGFVAHARRGYYDCLLTSGVSRVHAAVVHWLLSAAPGVLCWSLVALTELTLAGTSACLAPGSLAALALVSTVPWATTLTMPRFTGAITWIVLAAMALVVDESLSGAAPAASPLASAATGLLAAVLVPTSLLTDARAHEPATIGGAMLLAIATVAAALRRTQRAALPLESGQ